MQNEIFYQLFEPSSSTYTYLLGDPRTREAVLIDPVLEMAERDLLLLKELDLTLKLILETHIHADHITGAAALRKKTGAKIGVAAVADASGVDIPLSDEQELRVGDLKIKVLATPGHTDSCLSFYSSGKVFTGDALLIRLAGRTDFQQGSAKNLYKSIHEKLFSLPDETLVYPAHDYRGLPYSTIALERKFNQRIGAGKTADQFEKIMAGLNLPLPKRIHEAVPANLVLGETVKSQLKARDVNGVPEIEPSDVHQHRLPNTRLVDVRRPEEFNNELGHVEGAELVPLGPELMQFLETANKDQEIVFICRSGARSGQATSLSRQFGFKNTMNMAGGMLRWNEAGLPVSRS